MKQIKECPICFDPRADGVGEAVCSKHGIPYDVLEDWANEQLLDIDEYYHDQIPVLQSLLTRPSNFVTRAKELGRINDKLTDTTAFLANVRELGSYHLKLLELLSSGCELLQSGGEYYIPASDGRRWSWPDWQLDRLRDLEYIQGGSITELGREAIRIYKAAHPLLFD